MISGVTNFQRSSGQLPGDRGSIQGRGGSRAGGGREKFAFVQAAKAILPWFRGVPLPVPPSRLLPPSEKYQKDDVRNFRLPGDYTDMYSRLLPSHPGLIYSPASANHDEKNPLSCTILEKTGKFLILQTDQPFSWSAIVGIEYDDLYCAGEIVGCAQQQDGYWMVQVEVAQVITSLQSLLLLHQQLGIVDSPPEGVPFVKRVAMDYWPQWSVAGVYD